MWINQRVLGNNIFKQTHTSWLTLQTLSKKKANISSCSKRLENYRELTYHSKVSHDCWSIYHSKLHIKAMIYQFNGHLVCRIFTITLMIHQSFTVSSSHFLPSQLPFVIIWMNLPNDFSYHVGLPEPGQAPQMSWLNKNCNLGATPHFQADPNRMNLTIYNYIFIVIHISIIIYIYIFTIIIIVIIIIVIIVIIYIYIYIYLYQSRETS